MNDFDTQPANEKQKKYFFKLCDMLGIDQIKAKEKAKIKFGLQSFSDIGINQISELIDALKTKMEDKTSTALQALIELHSKDNFDTGEVNKIGETYPEHLAKAIIKYFYVQEK